MSTVTASGSGRATVVTKSAPRPRRSSSSTRSAAFCSTLGRSPARARGVNARERSLRNRACVGPSECSEPLGGEPGGVMAKRSSLST